MFTGGTKTIARFPLFFPFRYPEARSSGEANDIRRFKLQNFGCEAVPIHSESEKEKRIEIFNTFYTQKCNCLFYVVILSEPSN